MVRGIIPFRCRECGGRFIALDIEWNASALSVPQKCPKCESMRTRPWSLWPSSIADSTYKKIWKHYDENR